MLAELMGFKVHVRLEYDEFLLEALFVVAYKVVFFEMLLQCVVVHIVMRLPRVSAVADKAPLMLVAAMLIKFVIVVEPLTTESAERVPFESCSSTLPILIAISHVLSQLLVRIYLMLVSKDLFVPGAEVAHLLVVNRANMTVQVGPTKASEVAARVGAIIPEKKHRVPNNIFTCVLDPNTDVRGTEVVVRIFLVAPRLVVGEDDEFGLGLQ